MKYIAILLLLAASACCSSMETAFSSVNRIRLKHKAAGGSKRAAAALRSAENFDRALTTILVINNIVNICSAALATIICADLFAGKYGEGAAAAISTAVMTVLVLIFGEVLPKSFAKQNAEKFAMGFAGLLELLTIVFTPVTSVFMLMQRSTSKLFRSSDGAPSVTEDELKYIIEEIEDEGVLEEKESDLVRSALEFDEITVEKILVPRVRIVAVEQEDDIEDIKELFIKERYSRMPVYEKTIDNIVGFITEKDFFALYTGAGPRPASISKIIQKALYVSEMKLISEVLYEMQRNKLHMAIVKDQYGGTSGLVTMEDIIEELVGEIYDENDEVIQPVISLGNGQYEIMADLSLNDMTELLELPANAIESGSNTAGGWVMELFGRIPEKGAEVTSGVFTVKVLEADDRSVSKILLKIDGGTEDGETE